MLAIGRKRKIILLEWGVDFTPKRESNWSRGVNGKSYSYVHVLEPPRIRTRPTTLYFKILEAVVLFNKKYGSSEKQLKVIRRRLAGHDFVVIRRLKKSLKNPPVYIDLCHGKVFVPRYYVENEPQLVAAVLDYRMQLLGIKVHHKVERRG